MCLAHWAVVPAALRRMARAALLDREVSPGDRPPLRSDQLGRQSDVLKAVNLAICAVAFAEGRARFDELRRPCAHLACQEDGVFGFGVSLRAGRLGLWYCARHRADPEGAGEPLGDRLEPLSVSPASSGPAGVGPAPAPTRADARQDQGAML